MITTGLGQPGRLRCRLLGLAGGGGAVGALVAGWGADTASRPAAATAAPPSPEPPASRPDERRLEITTAATTMAMQTRATPVRRPTLWLYLTTLVATSRETRFMTLSSGLIAGPAVSLNGSPTVSPMTVAACASEPLPP